MKLRNFLLVAAVMSVAGITGLYFACKGDEAPPPPKVARKEATPRPDPKPDSKPDSNPDSKPDPGPAATDGLRPVDQFVMGWAGKDLGTDKKKDATKGRPYKVNLYQDDGNSTVNRAKVDLDRDDKWDEKWTFDGDHVSRKVAPADDESYTESYVWDGSGWVSE